MSKREYFDVPVLFEEISRDRLPDMIGQIVWYTLKGYICGPFTVAMGSRMVRAKELGLINAQKVFLPLTCFPNVTFYENLAERALVKARKKLEEIVDVVPPDDGVVLLSNDGPTHMEPGVPHPVYDHQHFSPLGDALIELHNILKGYMEPE